MYQHFVQYYETDKMGITHHSNYIRFMEEARLDFFKKLGFDYLDFEKMGVISPVIGLNNIRYNRKTPPFSKRRGFSVIGYRITIPASRGSRRRWP